MQSSMLVFRLRRNKAQPVTTINAPPPGQIRLHFYSTFGNARHDILLQENIQNDDRDDRHENSREDQFPRVAVLS